MVVPKVISLHTTTICNLKCSVCCRQKLNPHAAGMIMEPEIWGKILEDCASLGFSGTISFSLFAEPLCDPLLFDRIDQIKERTNAGIHIHTNGTLILEKIKEIRNRSIDMVTVSMLGGMDKYLDITGVSPVSIKIACNVLSNNGVKFELCVPGMSDREMSDIIELVYPAIPEKITRWPIEEDLEFKSFMSTGEDGITKVMPISGHRCSSLDYMFINIYGDLIKCPIDWFFHTKYGKVGDTSIFQQFDNRLSSPRRIVASTGVCDTPICTGEIQ